MNSDERILRILETSACLRQSQLLAYINGSLFPEELRVVELHLSECDLCTDALEGLSSITEKEAFINSLTAPVPAENPPSEKKHTPPVPPEPIYKRTDSKGQPHAEKASPSKIHTAPRPRNYSWLGGIGIAALLILGGTLLWQFEVNHKKTEMPLAVNQPEKESYVKDSETPAAGDNRDATTGKQAGKTVPSRPDTASSVAAAVPGKPADNTMLQPTGNNMPGKTDTPAAGTQTAKAEKAIAPVTENAGMAAMAEKETASQRPQAQLAAIPPKTADVRTDKKQAKGEFSDVETGISLFRKKQYGSALLYLRAAEENDMDPRHWDAVYYAALCNKYIGKTGKARRLFKRIIKADAPQKSAAEKQLDDLSKSSDNSE